MTTKIDTVDARPVAIYQELRSDGLYKDVDLARYEYVNAKYPGKARVVYSASADANTLTDDQILALSLKHIPEYESTDEQVVNFARALIEPNTK